MKTLPLAIFIAAGALMSGCSHTKEVWVATKKTSVFASDDESDYSKASFTLEAGDSCIRLGENPIVKDYLHTEIQCQRGHGWVIDKQNFDNKSTD